MRVQMYLSIGVRMRVGVTTHTHRCLVKHKPKHSEQRRAHSSSSLPLMSFDRKQLLQSSEGVEFRLRHFGPFVTAGQASQRCWCPCRLSRGGMFGAVHGDAFNTRWCQTVGSESTEKNRRRHQSSRETKMYLPNWATCRNCTGNVIHRQTRARHSVGSWRMSDACLPVALDL